MLSIPYNLRKQPAYSESLEDRLKQLYKTKTCMTYSQIRLWAAQLVRSESSSHRSLPKHAISQVLALEALHSQGLYHCDIKPSNIMIDSWGRLVLVDFGISEHGSGVLDGSRGTPGYIAPEIEGGPCCYAAGAADIYSLGIVLYEMIQAPCVRLPPLTVTRASFTD